MACQAAKRITVSAIHSEMLTQCHMRFTRQSFHDHVHRSVWRGHIFIVVIPHDDLHLAIASSGNRVHIRLIAHAGADKLISPQCARAISSHPLRAQHSKHSETHSEQAYPIHSKPFRENPQSTADLRIKRPIHFRPEIHALSLSQGINVVQRLCGIRCVQRPIAISVLRILRRRACRASFRIGLPQNNRCVLPFRKRATI